MALTKDVFGDNFRENLLEMNASDERKLESIRTKVKQFARTSPYGGAAFKIIFLMKPTPLPTTHRVHYVE